MMREFAGAHDDMANGVSAACMSGAWVSCAEDKSVALTDWRAGRVIQVWQGHLRGVNRVVAVPAIGAYLSGSRDTTVKVWREGEADATATLSGHDLTVSAVAAAEDGGLALSGSRDSSLRLWDLSTGQLSSRNHVSRNVVTCLQWVPGEASLVAQGSEDLRLRLWDVRTLSKPAAIMEGYVYFPNAVDCMGSYVCTGSNGFNGVGCEVRTWDRRMNAQVYEPLVGHYQAIFGLCLLRGSGRGGGGVGAESDGDGVGGLTVGSGRSPLLAASGSKDGEVRLWDVSSGGEAVCSMQLQQEGITGLASALAGEEDARLYASTTTGRVHAIDATGGGGGGAEPWALKLTATASGDADRRAE